jgi:hypothetical protein
MFHWPFGFNGATGPSGVVQKEKTTGSYKTVMPRNGDHVHFVMTKGMINLHNARQAKGIWSHEPRAYMTLAGDAYRMLIFDLVFAQAEDDDASNGPNGAGGPRRYFAFHEIDALDVWTRHREAIDADDALVLAKMGQGPGSLRANLADALAKRHDAVMLYGNMEQTKGRTYAFLSFFAEFADAADPVPHDTLEPIERIARAALVAKADRAAAMAKLMTGPTESWGAYFLGLLADIVCDVIAVVGVYGTTVLDMANLQLLVVSVLGSEMGKLLASVIGSNTVMCFVILVVEVAISVSSIFLATTGIGAPMAAAAVFASSALSKAGSNCTSIMSYLGPLFYPLAKLAHSSIGDMDLTKIYTKVTEGLGWNSLAELAPLAAFTAVDVIAVPLIKQAAHKNLVCILRVGVHLLIAHSIIEGRDANFAREYRQLILPAALRIAYAHISSESGSKNGAGNRETRSDIPETDFSKWRKSLESLPVFERDREIAEALNVHSTSWNPDDVRAFHEWGNFTSSSGDHASYSTWAEWLGKNRDTDIQKLRALLQTKYFWGWPESDRGAVAAAIRKISGRGA